ncbi:MAG: hypothetical protein WD002_09120 [Pseudomonadales bacterium]
MTQFRPIGLVYLLAPLLLGLANLVQATDLECTHEIQRAGGSYQFALEDEPAPPAADELRIGEILYTRLPIFDESNPRENNAVFRWANRFHILTQEKTVRRDLLFRSQDPYEPRLLSESARLLRRRGHLYDAAVRPVRLCGDELDIEVITRDVWSFTPEISFDRSGGESTHRIGIAEGNLFGTGRELSFATTKDTDRSSNRFVYTDDNVGGGWLRTRLLYENSDDGYHQYGLIQLPFYSLDTTHAWRFSLDKLKQEESQYFRGDEISAVRHEVEESILSYGWSRGLVNGKTQRWQVGHIFRDDHFSSATSLPAPGEFPIDKTLSYPFVSFTEIEDNYTTSFNLDQIHRTEDLHLGHTFTITLGYAATNLGSDQDRLIASGAFRDTLDYDDKSLLQHNISWQGLWNFDTSKSEDVQASYFIRYFHSQTTHRSFYSSFSATWTHNLNSNNQIILGGLTGARAFDNRFQTGDRKMLLTLEERQYTDVHFLNLIRLGFAAFLDIGRAWEPGADDGIDDDWLADIGIGIRLASSKANVGKIIHIDFAFPITNRNDPGVDSLQVAINIKNSF